MDFKTKPWSHQRNVLELIEEEGRNFFALLWDMGTGKTKTGCDLIRLKMALENRYLKTLIICPVPVMENWKRELLTHTYLGPQTIRIVDGVTKLDGKKLKNPQKKLRLEQISKPNGATVFILNTENVSNEDLWNLVLEMGIELLIVDEAHRFKAHNGKRTKALHKLSEQKQLKYKFILTGTPILQSALDLWSQYYILDPDILGANFFAFRAKYFYDANAAMPSHLHFPNWTPKTPEYFRAMGLPIEDVNETLHGIIYKHSNRVMKDEVLDLPDRTYQTLYVELHKEQARLYTEMHKDAVAFLDKDFEFIPMDVELDTLPEYMKADLAITKILRLQQLICGVFTNAEGEVKTIPTERIKVLKELLEELLVDPKNKIVIWSVFTPTYREIAKVLEEVLPKDCIPVMLTGEQSKDEKQFAIDFFNNDPDCRVMVANQGAGGTGVNLTAANYDIYYSRSFNLEHDLQSNARTHRGGQKRKTTRIDLVTPNTIDEEIVEALRKKREDAEDILAARGKEFTKDELTKLLRGLPV